MEDRAVDLDPLASAGIFLETSHTGNASARPWMPPRLERTRDGAYTTERSLFEFADKLFPGFSPTAKQYGLDFQRYAANDTNVGTVLSCPQKPQSVEEFTLT